MNDIAIRAENLSKLYRIGQIVGYKTLRESLTNAVSAPFRKLRQTENRKEKTSDVEQERVSSSSQASISGHVNTIWALKDVSFEVKQGEVVGIIGKNGSGKSTLLKILSRIISPTEGYAEIYGRVGSLLEVGTGFHPELTGRENIYLSGAVLGMKKAEVKRKFDEIVAFSEIEKFLDTPVKRYSSGMYVRLAFAVAAHLEPEILLVDEVLAVGDAEFQKKCLGKMGDIARGGRTVLFVSHNIAAIRKLCSHTMLLERGQKIMAGLTDSVVAQYLSAGASEISAIVALSPGLLEAPGRGVSLRFFAQNGTPQAQFRLGEPWRIVLEFEILRPVSHTIAAVGLVTFDSVPVITYWSKPRDLKPGRYLVEYEVAVPLAACDVQFGVGLSSYERTFYYVQGVGRVTISDVAQRDQPFRASGTGLLLGIQNSEIRLI